METQMNKKMDAYFGAKLLFIIFLGVVGVLSLSYSKFPGTTTDEFGYMYFPALVSGWDWTEVISYHGFYGMGTGVLWIPLFLLFKGNPELIYQGIVALNVFMLILCFLLSEKCAKKLFPDWDRKLRLLSCAIVTLYPAYLLYTEVAISETFLLLLYWILIYLFIKIYEKATAILIIVASAVSGYMILVHLRTIGVAGMCCAFMILAKYRRKINWRQMLLFFLILISFLGIWSLYKNYYYSQMSTISVVNQANSSVSILGFASQILENLSDWLERLLTRVFYYLVVGNICLVGALAFFKQQKLYLPKNSDNDIFLFVFLTFFANLMMFVIQGIETPRLDHVVYGRYTEFLAAPVFLCGFYYLEKQRLKTIVGYFFSILAILIIPFVVLQMRSAESMIFAIDSAVGLGAFFDMYMSSENLEKTVAYSVLFLILCWIFFAIIKYKVKRRNLASLLLIVFVGCIWLYMGVQAKNSFNDVRIGLYNQYNNVLEEVHDQDKEEYIYIRELDDYCAEVKYLQFLIPDKQIHIVDRDDFSIEEVEENTLVLCKTGDNAEYELSKLFSKKVETSIFTLLMQE